MTSREHDVLSFIVDFQNEKGYSPSVREIAKAVNTKSTSHIYYMLGNLENKGYITRAERVSRSIKVLKH